MKVFSLFLLLMLFGVTMDFIAGCNHETRYPVISTASAATMDTHDSTNNIDLDLSVARINEEHVLRGNQVYYDLGTEPSKVGTIVVRLNSTQSGPITLAPGGSITFNSVAKLYISNDAQSGKHATLLVNDGATVSNNPTSPLSSGLPSNRYGLGGAGLVNYSTPFNIVAGGPNRLFEFLSSVGNLNGIMLKRISMTTMLSDYRDITQVLVSNDGATTSFPVISIKNGFDVVENLYLPPGYGLFILQGATGGPAVTYGTIGSQVTMLYQRL